MTVVCADGKRRPVECRYVGVERHCHVWEVLWPPADVVGLTVQELPGRTAIRVARWKGPQPGQTPLDDLLDG